MDITGMLTMLFFGGLLLMMVFMLVWAAYYHLNAAHQRSKAVRRLGEKLGADFSGAGRFPQALRDFNLLRDDKDRQVRNVLRGRSHDIDFCYADYQHRDDEQGLCKHSLLFLTSDDADLPHFQVVRKGLFEQVVSVLDSQKKVPFKNFLEFHKRYLVRGLNPDHITAAFRPEVIDFFEQHDINFSIECSGEHMLCCYQYGERRPVDRLESFILRGIALLLKFSH